MTQEQIVEIIKDRLVEFKYCNKNDSCHYYARALELILNDIETEGQ